LAAITAMPTAGGLMHREFPARREFNRVIPKNRAIPAIAVQTSRSDPKGLRTHSLAQPNRQLSLPEEGIFGPNSELQDGAPAAAKAARRRRCAVGHVPALLRGEGEVRGA
jgi:hypothetical protein